MSDVDRVISRIKLDGLAAIKPGSKDGLDVHSMHFARAYKDYVAAIGRAYADALDRGGAIDMTITDAPARAYELTATLYAPGLIGALAQTAVVLDRRLGQVNQLARAALKDADSKGAVHWRAALQAIVTEIGKLADG